MTYFFKKSNFQSELNYGQNAGYDATWPLCWKFQRWVKTLWPIIDPVDYSVTAALVSVFDMGQPDRFKDLRDSDKGQITGLDDFWNCEVCGVSPVYSGEYLPTYTNLGQTISNVFGDALESDLQQFHNATWRSQDLLDTFKARAVTMPRQFKASLCGHYVLAHH